MTIDYTALPFKTTEIARFVSMTRKDTAVVMFRRAVTNNAEPEFGVLNYNPVTREFSDGIYVSAFTRAWADFKRRADRLCS